MLLNDKQITAGSRPVIHIHTNSLKAHQPVHTLISPRGSFVVLVLSAVFAACTTSPAAITSLPSPSTSSSTYSSTDVATHNSKASCWLIVNQGVYDVTSYGPRHPGGDQIYSGCGQDVTQYMQTEHARQMQQLLPAFKIGTLSK